MRRNSKVRGQRVRVCVRVLCWMRDWKDFEQRMELWAERRTR